MSTELASVIVVPRERFGVVAESLDSLLACTAPGHELIYVEVGSPPDVRAYVQDKGLATISSDHYLSPNQARNLGLAAASRRYVVFVDNDVIYSPGWLEALIRCAEETGADVVCPLMCEGVPVHSLVHHAGGEYTPPAHLAAFHAAEPASLQREIREKMYGHKEPLAEWRDRLQRSETGFCEFHCVLVRRSIFERIGPLDEQLLATKEHIDLSLSVRAAGGTIWFEPASLVTYLIPNRHYPLRASDLSYFLLRWSDAWQRQSLDHLRAKWGLRETQYFTDRYPGLAWRRDAALRQFIGRIPLVGRRKPLANLLLRVVRKLERPVNRLMTVYHAQRHPPRTAA